MYSKEEREKAIKLYIKYNKCAADVIHELGYPDRNTLVKWSVIEVAAISITVKLHHCRTNMKS
jgi:hypothetical protein